MATQEFIKDLCDHFGTKKVTKTDKLKSAFVLNEEQRNVMSAAGFEPGDGGENALLIEIEVLDSDTDLKLQTSYYNAIRKEAGRLPETRMGRDLANWVEIGDVITLANIGKKVVAWKAADVQLSLNELAGRIIDDVDIGGLLDKARKASGVPPKQEKTVSDFRRNTAVVAGALARAGNSCEMPECSRDLFERADGTTYLEVHHIQQLADGGEDTMANAAALCPTCHRELHYGAKKVEKQAILKDAILAKES